MYGASSTNGFFDLVGLREGEGGTSGDGGPFESNRYAEALADDLTDPKFRGGIVLEDFIRGALEEDAEEALK